MFPQTNELKYLLKQISQMPHAFETPSCYKLVRNYHHAQPMFETLKPKVKKIALIMLSIQGSHVIANDSWSL